MCRGRGTIWGKEEGNSSLISSHLSSAALFHLSFSVSRSLERVLLRRRRQATTATQALRLATRPLAVGSVVRLTDGEGGSERRRRGVRSTGDLLLRDDAIDLRQDLLERGFHVRRIKGRRLDEGQTVLLCSRHACVGVCECTGSSGHRERPASPPTRLPAPQAKRGRRRFRWVDARPSPAVHGIRKRGITRLADG